MNLGLISYFSSLSSKLLQWLPLSQPLLQLLKVHFLHDDPLFLHHGENPSVVLVSQPLIGGENYHAWARSIRKSLIAKNKLGFIDNSFTLSSPIVNSPSAIQAWILVDNLMGTWIINLVSPKIQASIIYKDTTLEIWNDLKETFCKGNGPKIFNLQNQIAELHQGKVSIIDFFT